MYSSLSQFKHSIRTEFDYENRALVKAEVTQYRGENGTKRKKRRKIKSDETRKLEVELTGKENFRINIYCSISVIIDRLSN